MTLYDYSDSLWLLSRYLGTAKPASEPQSQLKIQEVLNEEF